MDERHFPFEQTVDCASFLDRVMSISFIAALPEDDRSRVQAALEKLAARQLEPLRYSCQVFVYQRTV